MCSTLTMGRSVVRLLEERSGISVPLVVLHVVFFHVYYSKVKHFWHLVSNKFKKRHPFDKL